MVSETKVDFYLLGSEDSRSRLLTACRLAEKAVDQGLRVMVRTASPAETAELDDLMWTFSDRSFLPHGAWPAEPEFAAATPVMIGSGAIPSSHRDVLINLAADVPAGVAEFGRICDIVSGDEDAKREGRERWRGYRGAGLRPDSHNL
jgi:DNA polymerase-3 subunit chi